MKKVIILVASMVLILMSPIMAEDDVEKDKVYSIFLEEEATYALKRLESTEFQNIPCLKGIYIGKGEWLQGKTIYIPKNQINIIVEYNSFDDYKNAMKKVYRP
jgi:hypothetical protein